MKSGIGLTVARNRKPLGLNEGRAGVYESTMRPSRGKYAIPIDLFYFAFIFGLWAAVFPKQKIIRILVEKYIFGKFMILLIAYFKYKM